MDDLLPVQDTPLAWSSVPIQALPKDVVGKLIWRAHESCAMIIPETWVDEVEGADGERKKVVLVQMRSSKTVGTWYVAYFFFLCMVGPTPIRQKCTACQKNRDKAHGAPFSRCLKAFHVSCARDGQASYTYFTNT